MQIPKEVYEKLDKELEAKEVCPVCLNILMNLLQISV